MPKKQAADYRIVVLQRGWVAVGRYAKTGSACRLEGASVIRRWGTSKGLGELRSGPLANTVLDPAGIIEFHELGEVLTIRVEAERWAPHCK